MKVWGFTYADNRPFVVQYHPFTSQGVTTLSDNLATTISFTSSQDVDRGDCSTFAIFSSNGSANPTCPTTPFSKNVKGLTPIFRQPRSPLNSAPHIRLLPTLGTINNLIGHYKVPRLDFLLQASHGTKRNYSPNANAPQSGYIRSRRHFMRCDFVGQAVS